MCGISAFRGHYSEREFYRYYVFKLLFYWVDTLHIIKLNIYDLGCPFAALKLGKKDYGYHKEQGNGYSARIEAKADGDSDGGGSPYACGSSESCYNIAVFKYYHSGTQKTDARDDLRRYAERISAY